MGLVVTSALTGITGPSECLAAPISTRPQPRWWLASPCSCLGRIEGGLGIQMRSSLSLTTSLNLLTWDHPPGWPGRPVTGPPGDFSQCPRLEAEEEPLCTPSRYLVHFPLSLGCSPQGRLRVPRWPLSPVLFLSSSSKNQCGQVCRLHYHSPII